MIKKIIFLCALIASLCSNYVALSQEQITFSNPQKYIIGDIQVEGVTYLQHPPIIRITGLSVGQKITIPGPDITSAVEKLWKQGLFSDIKIYASRIQEDTIFLTIFLTERARLNTITFEGIKKRQQTDLLELIDFKTHEQITENKKNIIQKKLQDFYFEKGYFNAVITIKEIPDTTRFNQSDILISIQKNKRVKIQDIVFEGNTAYKNAKLYRTMKNTKRNRWFVLKRSKYIPKDFLVDKESILELYKKDGYRDVMIYKDSIITIDSISKKIVIGIDEGKKYYFRNITWLGNSVYQTELLEKVLNIKKGDVYIEALLQDKIFGLDGVSSLYLDNGYLFFNAEPVEINIDNDSVDIEIRIYEGQQATINNIVVKGNNKTNDQVIYREIRTKPGDLFSRSDIIRTQRELAMLGYFDPEKMEINPKPNPQNGTVDIEYGLEEKSTDQIELSGGWSGQYVIGSVRLVLNNFSIKNMLNGSEWKPIPSGDGQSLTLNASFNPRYYQYYSFSFSEPWLGGKKPNGLSFSVYHSVRGNGYERSNDNFGNWKTVGISLGLQRDLQKPDDYFTLYHEIGAKRYNLNNYSSGLPEVLPDTIITKSITFATSLSRNSIDQPLYPRRGSSFSLRLELTPPHSAFMENANNTDLTPEQRYNWIEYHKWTFKSKIYTQIYDKLVLETRADFGFLGFYNENFKSPFERFDVGGDGLSGGFYMYGIDIIPLRGYTSGAITPFGDNGANLYNKFSLELRYPLTLKPEATIYGLVFAEGANAWMNFNNYNPFELKRSAGFGVRLFIPMMGLIGFDYGYGFDNVDGKNNIGKWQPSFVLGQQF